MQYGFSKDGVFRLIFSVSEARLLESLPRRLLEVLDRDETMDAASRRLFPRFSDDPEVDRDLRAMAGADLRRKKQEQARDFAAQLKGMTLRDNRSRYLRLPPADLALWIAFLNDVRLCLGELLLITETGSELLRRRATLGPDERLYLFLTELQGLLIEADEPGE